MSEHLPHHIPEVHVPVPDWVHGLFWSLIFCSLGLYGLFALTGAWTLITATIPLLFLAAATVLSLIHGLAVRRDEHRFGRDPRIMRARERRGF